MPKVPSAPTNDTGEIVAGRVRRSRRRARTISPSGSTTSRPRTWLVVTPYLSVCGPPELVGDVAADRTCRLAGSGPARRKGRLGDGLRDIQVDDAGLDDGAADFRVDF